MHRNAPNPDTFTRGLVGRGSGKRVYPQVAGRETADVGGPASARQWRSIRDEPAFSKKSWIGIRSGNRCGLFGVACSSGCCPAASATRCHRAATGHATDPCGSERSDVLPVYGNPSNAVVNALQGITAIKAPNATIQGRTFDLHGDSFTLDLAEIEVEKVPEVGGVGFKFDMAFGDTQNIYNDTIIAATGANSLSQFDKTFQHASISYVAPVGKGLRFDFGKFVTHIGGETIESVKNANFSHSFFYTYAIPFQDTGMRIHYDHNDKLYSEVYILNGWNVGFDLNKGKTFGYSVSYTPGPQFQVVANYLGGPEQPDNNTNWRHLGDFQIYVNTPKLRTMTNIDVAQEKGALANGANTKWAGIAEVVRYRATERFDPSFRAEWFYDPDGFSTGVAQKKLVGFTATLDTFLGKGDNDKILVRPEFRYDHSEANFFSHGNIVGLTRKYQATAGINLIYYF